MPGTDQYLINSHTHADCTLSFKSIVSVPSTSLSLVMSTLIYPLLDNAVQAVRSSLSERLPDIPRCVNQRLTTDESNEIVYSFLDRATHT